MILSLLLVFTFVVKLNCSVSFTRNMPPLMKKQQVDSGDLVNISASWQNSSVDIDIEVYSPTQDLTQTPLFCACNSPPGTQQQIFFAVDQAGEWTILFRYKGTDDHKASVYLRINGTIAYSAINTYITKLDDFFFVNVAQPGNLYKLSYQVSTAQTYSMRLYEMSEDPINGTPIHQDLTIVNGSSVYVFMNQSGLVRHKFTMSDYGTSLPSAITYKVSYSQIVCSDQITNCLTCTSTSHIVCTSCSQNKVPKSDGSSCQQCVLLIQGCTQCTAYNNCTDCSNDYFLSSPTQCLSCSIIANCQQCNSSTECTSCKPGFFLDTNTTCDSCASYLPNCSQCDSETVCTLCAPGFGMDSANDSCVPCGESIPDCQLCFTTQECAQCKPGLTPANSSCYPCDDFLPNCLQCSNSSNCTLCLYLYSPIAGQCIFCQQTLAYCINCTSQTNCSQCSVSAILLDNNTCKGCQTYLTACSSCQFNDSFICLGFMQGYYLSRNITQECLMCNATVTLCTACTGPYECTRCQNGFYLESPNATTCSMCNGSISNCLRCSINGSKCYQCELGLYPRDSTQDQCMICNQTLIGCSQCVSSSTCTQCISNQFLMNNVTNQCQNCFDLIPNCGTCSSQTVCLTPFNDTYYLQKNTLISCSTVLPLCQRCSDGSACTHCEPTYFLDGSTCQKCPLNCKYCSNETLCLQCTEQFKLGVNNTCQCQIGWYVPGGCTEILGCMALSQLSGKDVCLMCSSENHFVFDQRKFNCSCQQGYKISGNQCIEQCGDGIHHEQECDDKNKISGDGCSSECKIENGFICQGHWSDPSVCKIQSTFEILPLYIVKIDGQNAAQLHFRVSPFITNLKAFDLKQLITLNTSQISQAVTSKLQKQQVLQQPSQKIIRVQTEVKLIDAKIDEQNQKIIVSFSYQQPIIDSTFHTTLDFSTIAQDFKPVQVALSTEGMSPILTCDKYNDVQIVLWGFGQALSYLLILFFIFSLIFHKMIGVQLLNSIQILVAVSVLSINELSTVRVFKSMNLIFGLTPIFQENYLSLVSPQKYRFFSEHRQIALNINIFLIVLSFIFLVFLLLKFILIVKKIQLQNENRVLRKLMKRKIKKKYYVKVDALIKEVEQDRFLLKDSIFHLNFRFLLLYERLLYPFSVILVPSTILYASMYATSSKKGQEFGQIWSLLTVVLLTLITLSVSVYEQRKFTSDKKTAQKTGKYQFSTFNKSCKIENIRKYSFLHISIPLLSSILIVSALLLQFANVVCYIVVILYIILVLYVKCSNPYILKIHNMFLMFLYAFVALHSVLIGLVNAEIIDDSSLIFIIMIEMGLIIICLAFGCYCIFKENALSNKNASKLSLGSNNSNKNQQKKHRHVIETIENNPFVYNKASQQNARISPNFQQKSTQSQNKKNYVLTKQQQKVELSLIKQRLRMELLRKRNYDIQFFD